VLSWSVQLGTDQVGGNLGARDLRRMRSTGLHPPLQQRGQAIERCDLEIVDINAPLLAQDFEERVCRIGRDVETKGRALPARRIEFGGAGGDARLPLAT
jgi:hypothetical protein